MKSIAQFPKERHFNDLDKGDVIMLLFKDDKTDLSSITTGYIIDTKYRINKEKMVVEIFTHKKIFSIYPERFDTKFENLTAKVYTTIEELIKENFNFTICQEYTPYEKLCS